MRRLFAILAAVVMLAALAGAAIAEHETVPRITKEELLKIMDDPTVIVLDVRKATDWRASEFMIKGAIRVNAREFDKFMKMYPTDQKLIFYCAWPDEFTSASLALKFMNKGYRNVYALKGGWREWFRSKYPVVPKP